jgi:hypothetical protein
MLSVENKPIMLSVIKLNAIMLSVFMLSVIMLSVVMLNVVAPWRRSLVLSPWAARTQIYGNLLAVAQSQV